MKHNAYTIIVCSFSLPLWACQPISSPATVAAVIQYNSDHHYGRTQRYKMKKELDSITPNIAQLYPDCKHIEIRAGDHIEGNECHGAMRGFLGRKLSRLCCCMKQPQKEAHNYLADLQKQSNQHPTITTLLIPGDHDFYDRDHTIPHEIEQRHLGLCYEYSIPLNNKLLYVVSCGVKPDKKTCTWLKNKLLELKIRHQNEPPVIITMHYDIANPDNRRWVSEEDCQNFLEALAEYSNIQEIAMGHTHSSYTLTWHDLKNNKEYCCTCAGGNRKIVSLYNHDGKRIETKFFKAQKNINGTYTAEEALFTELIPEESDASCCACLPLQRWWNNRVVDQ